MLRANKPVSWIFQRIIFQKSLPWIFSLFHCGRCFAREEKTVGLDVERWFLLFSSTSLSLSTPFFQALSYKAIFILLLLRVWTFAAHIHELMTSRRWMRVIVFDVFCLPLASMRARTSSSRRDQWIKVQRIKNEVNISNAFVRSVNNSVK